MKFLPLALYIAGEEPHTTIQAAVNEAAADSAGRGAVYIPPNYRGSDGYSNPNGVVVLDMRQGGNLQIALAQTGAPGGSQETSKLNITGMQNTLTTLGLEQINVVKWRIGTFPNVDTLRMSASSADLSAPEVQIFVTTGNMELKGGMKTGSSTVAGLPAGVEGRIFYATNGRKVGEGAGLGTGVPVYFSNGAWRVFSTDAPVAA